MNRTRAGGYQSRGGYQSQAQGGSYQAQGGSYNQSQGSYQDQGANYQDQGANYQDQGTNYQDQGANYQDQGGYQSQGGNYQDQGGYNDQGSYQDQGESYAAQGGDYQESRTGYQDQGGSYQEQGGSYQAQGGNYQAQGGGYQAKGASGLGLLGKGPGSGGQSSMKSMSLGMKRMTGDAGWNAPGAERGRMAGANAGSRPDVSSGAGLLGSGPQPHQARKQQQQRGRMQEAEAVHQSRERQPYREDNQQLDSRRNYTNENNTHSYGSDNVATQRGLMDQPVTRRGPDYGGRSMEQPTGNAGYFEGEQYEEAASVHPRGPNRDQQMRQGRVNATAEYENRAPRVSRFSDDTSVQGRYSDNMGAGGGGRGLMQEPTSQAGMMNRQGSGQSQGQASVQARSMMNRPRPGQGPGQGAAEPRGMMNRAGTGAGLVAGRGRGGMQQDRGGARPERRSDDQIGAMLARRDRQMELMEKAEVQLKMIQESNKHKEQQLQRERLERERQQQEALALKQQEALALQQQQQEALAQQQQEALTQQQLMMQAQLQQQQQQQKRRRPMRTPNDGILGEGPRMGGGPAHTGDIPSIFDVPTKQTMRPGLGKRPASSGGGPRFGDNKRPRQKLGDGRDRSSRWGDAEKPSRRDNYDQRRNRSTSNSRDRKDSETRRGSDHASKTPDKSPRVTTPKDGGSKPRSETKKGKDEGARGWDNKKDAPGNTTQVTVEMQDEYDPSQPTADTDEPEVIILDDDPSDDAQKKTEAPKADEETKGDEKLADAKPAEDKSAEAEGEKPMEISLTVTVNKKGRSVNDKDRAGEEKQKREKKYKCNVCNIDCYDEPSFSRHMNGMKHRKNMELVMSGQVPDAAALLGSRKFAEQHLRQIEGKWRGGSKTTQSKQGPGKTMETFCKVCDKKYTGAYKDHTNDAEHKAREDRRKAGCKMCKVPSFSSYTDFTKHVQSQWHSKQCNSARQWPECKLCNQRFKSPRKFVRHCKTDHHIQNKEKKKSGEEEEMDELVTLDTVGFEDDRRNTDLSELKAKAVEAKPVQLTSTPKPTSNLDMGKPAGSPIMEEVLEVPKDHDPKVPVGVAFVKSVTGFFCKLCHKFYNNETSARVAHCQSKNHFDKYKRYMQSRISQRRLEKDGTFIKPEEATKSSDVKPEPDEKQGGEEKTDAAPQVNGNTGPEDMDTGVDNSPSDNTEPENRQDKTEADNTQENNQDNESQADTGADNSQDNQSQANTGADNSQDNGQDNKSQADTEADKSHDNHSQVEISVNSSPGDESKVEASAYETADEHRDSTINITMSVDTDDTAADNTDNTADATPNMEEEGRAEDAVSGEVITVEAAVTEEATTPTKKSTPQRAKRGRATARRGRK